MNTKLLLLLIVACYRVNGASVKQREANEKILAAPMGKILDINAKKELDLFEGDIRMPVRRKPAVERNGIKDPDLKWTPNIPYVIHPEFTFEVKEKIESVLREFSVRLCVNFVRRQNEVSYLHFKKESGCYSSVGMVGYEQIVSIGSGCESFGVIKHETMHALGFWHEQSRYDRDTYVEIMWANIQPGKEHNFNMFSEDEITTFDEPYDYSSLLHYNPTAFSVNGEPTIVSKQSGYDDVMGQRQDFSLIDLSKLRKLYQCNPIDGWTEWTGWSSCDIDCKKFRDRFCEGSSCLQDKETSSTNCDSSCFAGVDPDCPQTTAAATHGYVTSSMFPFNYKVDVECSQTIVVPAGATIELQFEFFDIEDYQGICYYDWLKVYDGADQTAPLIGTYCGKSTPSNIRSSGNHLTLSLFSDSSVSQRGYLANFYSTTSLSPLGMCHFEGDLSACGWTHDNTADFQWARNKGPTVSSGTGPSTDHTSGHDTGYYMYVETSSPQTSGMVARLLTPSYPAPTNGNCVEFYFNMFGDNIDTLSVILKQEIDSSTTESLTIFSTTGNHGSDEWLSASVNVYGQYPYKLAFQGRRGNGWMGDMAIDDVTIYPVSCDVKSGKQRL